MLNPTVSDGAAGAARCGRRTEPYEDGGAEEPAARPPARRAEGRLEKRGVKRAAKGGRGLNRHQRD